VSTIKEDSLLQEFSVPFICFGAVQKEATFCITFQTYLIVTPSPWGSCSVRVSWCTHQEWLIQSIFLLLKLKKLTFLLVYNSCLGVLLWYFHICIQCTLVWFIPFSPFLKWLRQVSMFHIHTCVENTSTIFTLLHSLHLFSLFHQFLPLNMACFTFLCFIRCLLIVQLGFALVFYL
jgi:hypothetical protein